LSINNSKYGLAFGRGKGATQYTLGIGIIDRTGNSYGVQNGYYFDALFRQRLKGSSQISFTSNNAFQIQENADPMFATNTMLSMNIGFVGLTANYNRIPNYDGDKIVKDYIETVMGGPSLSFSLFRHRLNGTIRYTVGKTIARESLRNGVGGTINYFSDKNGLTVNLSGFYPLRDPTNLNVPITETRYGSLTISKRINIPVNRYRLYDIKTILFRDENDNRILDKNEELLSNATVVIDDKSFTTNSKGEIKYKNMKPGVYHVNFSTTSHGDLIASNGSLQVIDLKEDIEIYVPFRKGKRLSGNIKINLDTLSNGIMTADKFKISITDTAGREYSTLSNGTGDFYLYLPQGKYHVALNPEAFKGTDFRPETMAYDVDMFTKEEAFVQFTVNQKKRQVRFLNMDKK
jgi:hypothetical protein